MSLSSFIAWAVSLVGLLASFVVGNPVAALLFFLAYSLSAALVLHELKASSKRR